MVAGLGEWVRCFFCIYQKTNGCARSSIWSQNRIAAFAVFRSIPQYRTCSFPFESITNVDKINCFAFVSCLCPPPFGLFAHLVRRTLWHLIPVSNGGTVGRFASHFHGLTISHSCPYSIAPPVLLLYAYGVAVANICFQNRNARRKSIGGGW